jgi:hypothetical protein
MIIQSQALGETDSMATVTPYTPQKLGNFSGKTASLIIKMDKSMQ